MLETFKERLKTKYSSVNLSQKRIDAIAEKLNKKFPDLTEEADHDAKIEDYYPEDEVKEIVEMEAKSHPKPDEPKKDEPVKDDNKSEEIPAWAKGIIETVNSLKSEKAAQSRAETLKAKFKEKNVPEKFWSKMAKPEKDEDVDAWVDEVTKDYSEMVPPSNDFAPGRSQGSRGSGKANEKEINNLVDGLMNIQPTAQN